jgi:hypothetical protein
MSFLLTIGLGYYLFTAKQSGPRTARVINTIFTLISVTWLFFLGYWGMLGTWL